jgi:hypothetical protein
MITTLLVSSWSSRTSRIHPSPSKSFYHRELPPPPLDFVDSQAPATKREWRQHRWLRLDAVKLDSAFSRSISCWIDEFVRGSEDRGRVDVIMTSA